MNSIYITPRRDSPLSVELQKVIAERNLLTSRSRSKVLDALNEIHAARLQGLHLRSRATQEILSSELSYVQQLETVMKFFMEPISSRGLISPDHFSTIFGQIETVYRVAGALVTELQTCEEDSLAPAFVRLAPFLKMYSLYACGYHKATSTLLELRSGRAGLALHTFLQAQESRPEVNCTLQSLLITPVQRLPRYRLLLKEVAAHTPPDHPHQITLKEALRGVETSASHVDALLQEQEHQNRLVQLQQSLTDGWPQVVSPGRSLVMEGSFMKVSKCGTRAVPVHLVLLTDMFLCCRQKSGQMMDCRYAFPLARSCIETVLGQAVFKVLCGTETLLLFAKNQEEGESWTLAMTKAIDELKSSRQTLKKQSSRKRIPKRIEDLEENTNEHNEGGFLAMTLRKRKRSTASQSNTSPQLKKSKKHRLSKNLALMVSQSPPKDSLFPLRAEKNVKSTSSLSPLCLPRPRCGSKAKKQSGENKEALGCQKENKSESSKSSSVAIFPTEKTPDTVENNPDPSNAETAQAGNPSWSAHCIELVRHVAQCIKSAVLRL